MFDMFNLSEFLYIEDGFSSAISLNNFLHFFSQLPLFELNYKLQELRLFESF